MRVITLLATATAAVALPLLVATPASADERTCYTPHVGGFDSFEVCYYLPIEPELGS